MRKGPSTRRRSGAALLVALLLTVLLPTAAAAAQPPPPGTIKVYVVEEPGETLADVARRTLGSGDRAGEIFDLNVGRRQRDGGALTDPNRLEPGWVLRLPADAGGPDVQLGRLSPDNAAGDPQAEGEQRYRTVLAVIGAAAVLAALTALVLARRTVGRLAARIADRFRRAGAALLGPWRRSARQRAREQLGRRLAADLATRADARDALGELARAAQPVRPYTVAVSPSGFARVPPGAAPPAPWTEVAPGRWRRPRDPRPPGPSDVQLPRLVRVGVDKDDAQVLVDLTYLDGVLAVTGDAEVARDLVVLLVEELLAAGEAVTVVDPDGRLGDHPGARRAARLRELPAQHRRAAAQVTAHPVVAAVAQPRPDAHIAVLTDVPSERDAAALAALCTPEHGWVAVVCTDLPGAHWRWTTAADGSADLGVLGHRVTVPVPSGGTCPSSPDQR